MGGVDSNIQLHKFQTKLAILFGCPGGVIRCFMIWNPCTKASKTGRGIPDCITPKYLLIQAGNSGRIDPGGEFERVVISESLNVAILNPYINISTK